MDPKFEFDVVTIVLAMLASIAIGFLWYGPLFGKPWMRAVGIPADHKPKGKQMTKAFGLMILGSLLTVFVFYITTQAFTPNTWLHNGERLTFPIALQGAFYVWAGFFLPVTFAKISWENRPNLLLFIDGGYHLVSLVSQALIFFAFLR